jgi:hypothetical protein
MRDDQSVSEMASEVLARQAVIRAEMTGESLEMALGNILRTDAGKRLGELREGEYRDERADRWQSSLPHERTEERRQGRLEERKRLREDERSRARRAEWESFMRNERRELELRKEGQLAELLGEALAGESPAALQQLAFKDRSQAEEGLVALMSQGKVYYKHLDELAEGDMAARIAADRLRETWLKGRGDRWLGHGGS